MDIVAGARSCSRTVASGGKSALKCEPSVPVALNGAAIVTPSTSALTVSVSWITKLPL